jgi:cystathionine beta-lyase/cystathionine gamma-synthase
VSRPDSDRPGRDRAGHSEPTGGSDRSSHGVRTRAVRGPVAPPDGASSTPVVHSATFSAPTQDASNAQQAAESAGAFYQRYGHPTLYACERRLADLEGAEAALLFSSGMGAISNAFFALMKSGDHAVALDQCYGGTHELLRLGAERWGWQVTFVDARDPGSWAAAFRADTRLFHVESPTNPTLCVVDLAAAASLAHAHGARLTVDNTFASPVGQHPIALGADLVLYSATKSIGGHGDLMAGVACGSAELIHALWKVRKVFGPVPDPALAWQIERSLKTLPLRLDAMNAGAFELSQRLQKHPGVAQVFYPGLPGHPLHDVAVRQMRHGFGHVLAVEVRGGAEAARALIEAFNLVRLAPSLGGVESVASIPAFTSHVALGAEGRARAGIPEGLVRISVGIEDPADLWADLEQALTRAVPARV